MKNTSYSTATMIAEELNKKFNENIFTVISNENDDEARIINEQYHYEGNDVDIIINEDGIHGTCTGHTEQFTSVQDVIDNIDSIFINE
jgi:hypothetical protein